MLKFGIYVATAVAAFAAEPAPPLLTTIAQIKSLTPEAAATSMPVRLRGVITVSLGARSGAFLQDESGGIYVSRKSEFAHVSPGSWVECTGWTAAGQFAPMVALEKFEFLGRNEIPAPIPVTLDQFATGGRDGEWVETRGIVRTLVENPNARPEFQIAVGRERLRVQVCDSRSQAPANLIDAEVRVSGVASGFFNRDRQLLMPVLFVPDWSHVIVSQPAAGEPFASELRFTTSLFRYAPGERSGHRCRVRGTVTHFLPGKAIFLRDAAGALYVETTQTAPLALGNQVEAAGFPAVRQGAAYLQDAIYRLIGTTPVPPAVPATPAAIVRGLIRPSELISIEGSLAEARRLSSRWLLNLKAGDQTFDVQVETPPARVAGLPDVGSRLRVTGILWTEDIDPRSRHIVPTSFRVLSRSPDDIEILERPSWWTRARLMQVVMTLLVVMAAALVWIWMLRRRVEAQTSTIAEKVAREAVADERARTACEIHDTLAQGFMGLGFQLEALSGELKETTPGVRQHLERAMKMLRHSHEEVRYSLKQLREPSVVRRPLGAALKETVERSVANSPPAEIRFSEHGDPFPLLPVVEHNILRIGQEAATNAVKHAQPRTMVVELRYEPVAVTLSIADDGRGFERPAGGVATGEHFGLQIMRERTQRIGGCLDIESHPGNGTRILLTVPRTKPEKPVNGSPRP